MYAEDPVSEIIIRPQTEEEEFVRIKQTLSVLPWFKKNGFQVCLPTHKSFEALYPEAEKYFGTTYNSSFQPVDPHFPNEEYFQKLFSSEIYDPSAYAKGLARVFSGKEIFEKALRKLVVLNKNWGFKLMPKYQILLTLWGTGGSYDSANGHIIIKTTTSGNFYIDPLSTCIHEMVHIGIEENLVRKFRLTHWEKEYVVDSICAIYLKELVPGYKYQKDLWREAHPDKLDSEVEIPLPTACINEETIVHTLPEVISHYVKEHPR